jgi:hypothetical protein
MWVLGMVVVVSNILWGLPDFLETVSGPRTLPGHFELSIHNASEDEVKDVVVRFLGPDFRLFNIEANVAAVQPKQSMPPPERVAIEWQDELGALRSQVERVPPFPTNQAHAASICALQVTLDHRGVQPVEWKVWSTMTVQ